MRVDEIREYHDVYSPMKAIYWLEDIERIRNGELIPPKFIQLHPEAWCPHRCEYCAYRYSGWDKHGMQFFKPEWAGEKPDLSRRKPVGRLVPGVSGLPKEIALRLPREMHEEGIEAIEITGSGEPLVYPYLLELLRQCSKWLEDIAIVTNGQFFTSQVADAVGHLTWLRFSIDACRRETYREIHGVDCFDRVIENLRMAIDRFPDTHIGVSFIVTRKNFREVAEAARFYRELGVRNIRFSFEYEPTGTARLRKCEIEEVREQLEDAKRLQNSRFRVFGQVERLDSYSRPNTDFTFCGYQHFVWNVGYDAKCYPCCIQIYHPEFAFGDLRRQSLHEIIYGEGRRRFLERFDVTKCHPCWLRDRNKFIETLLAPERRLGHVRFV